MPVIYGVLVCEREQHNIHDSFAVAVYKGSSYHCRSCRISLQCALKIGCSIMCKVTEHRRYSQNSELSQSHESNLLKQSAVKYKISRVHSGNSGKLEPQEITRYTVFRIDCCVWLLSTNCLKHFLSGYSES